MPIDLSWYIPLRVIRAHVYDEAGTAQLKQMVEEGLAYLQEGSAPVHILLDDATAQPPPLSIREFKSILDVAKQPTDKLGWVIGIGDVNVIAKVVIPMLLKILKIKFVRVATIDEAISFLRKQDLSLKSVEIEKS